MFFRLCLSSLIAICVLSGCTRIGISDPKLLAVTKTNISKESLLTFPINVAAESTCRTSTGAPTMGGVTTSTSCSNTGRISALAVIFAERGIKIIPSTDPSAPHIIIRTDKMNGFLEQTTGFFNLLTFGIVPMHSYIDYIVTYKSPKDNVDISKKVRISSTTSWFSLLLSNPENLTEREIKSRAEKNLIHAVLDDANIGNKSL